MAVEEPAPFPPYVPPSLFLLQQRLISSLLCPSPFPTSSHFFLPQSLLLMFFMVVAASLCQLFCFCFSFSFHCCFILSFVSVPHQLVCSIASSLRFFSWAYLGKSPNATCPHSFIPAVHSSLLTHLVVHRLSGLVPMWLVAYLLPLLLACLLACLAPCFLPSESNLPGMLLLPQHGLAMKWVWTLRGAV